MKPKRVHLNLTPKGEIFNAPTAAGVDRIRFRATLVQGDKTIERTALAQGRAAKEISNVIKAGKEVRLKCVYSRMPITPKPGEKIDPEGKVKLGAEYISIIGLPTDKAA